jgi:hypothetical protein
MRDFQIGTDLIGSLRAGAYVAAAEDDYVVLYSGVNRFAVFVDGGHLAEFTHNVESYDQAQTIASVWLEAFRRGADFIGETLVDA